MRVIKINIFPFVLFTLIASCFGCKREFEEKTFRGYTNMGTVVALDLTAEGGNISGFGFHRFSNCQLNRVEIEGTINSSGEFELTETLTSNAALFGTIEGTIDDENTAIDCIWRNSRNLDPTPIQLSFSRRVNSEQILTALPACGGRPIDVYDRLRDFFN